MTVGELIRNLENFDEDMKVVIGMIQQYGSDWAYNIIPNHGWSEGIKERPCYLGWGGSDTTDCCVLTLGEQIGTVVFEDDDDEEY